MTKRQQAIENTRANAFMKIARKFDLWNSGLVSTGSGDSPEIAILKQVAVIIDETECQCWDIEHNKEFDG